jgi:hypothetical protein
MQIVLADQDCEISVLMRGEHLYLNLVVNGVTIQNGAIILDTVPIIQIPTDAFSGTLAMVDIQGNEAPRYEGLGERWLLCYWGEEELIAPRNYVPEFDGPIGAI